MAERAEALAQLSRLLGDARLRDATPAQARQAVTRALPRLADGLIAETAASDDVMDHETAVSYVEERLAFLGELIEPADRERLQQDLLTRIARW